MEEQGEESTLLRLTDIKIILVKIFVGSDFCNGEHIWFSVFGEVSYSEYIQYLVKICHSDQHWSDKYIPLEIF